MQKDNSTYLQKLTLRRELLNCLADDPVVMETHGGAGKLWQACYSHVSRGVVFEKDPDKIVVLAKQRPGWSVYEGDSEKAIAAGFGAHLPVNFLDCDPYGQPWNVIDGFLFSRRPKPKTLCIAVNDGLRQKIQLNGGWDVESLRPIIEKYGNGLYKKYLEVCEILLKAKAAQVGYDLSRFWGYYTGHGNGMTHYAAILTADTSSMGASN